MQVFLIKVYPNNSVLGDIKGGGGGVNIQLGKKGSDLLSYFLKGIQTDITLLENNVAMIIKALRTLYSTFRNLFKQSHLFS